MDKDLQEKAYEDAKAELIELTNQRGQLDRRIARLKQLVAGMEAVIKDKGEQFILRALVAEGLQENCLDVLQAAYKKLAPAEVVYELRERGVDVDKYANPTAVVTTSLKRLVESGKVEEEKDADGKIRYGPKPQVDTWIETMSRVMEKVNLDVDATVRKMEARQVEALEPAMRAMSNVMNQTAIDTFNKPLVRRRKDKKDRSDV
jgi:hypothetical protein